MALNAGGIRDCGLCLCACVCMHLRVTLYASSHACTRTHHRRMSELAPVSAFKCHCDPQQYCECVCVYACVYVCVHASCVRAWERNDLNRAGGGGWTVRGRHSEDIGTEKKGTDCGVRRLEGSASEAVCKQASGTHGAANQL